MTISSCPRISIAHARADGATSQSKGGSSADDGRKEVNVCGRPADVVVSHATLGLKVERQRARRAREKASGEGLRTPFYISLRKQTPSRTLSPRPPRRPPFYSRPSRHPLHVRLCRRLVGRAQSVRERAFEGATKVALVLSPAKPASLRRGSAFDPLQRQRRKGCAAIIARRAAQADTTSHLPSPLPLRFALSQHGLLLLVPPCPPVVACASSIMSLSPSFRRRL